MIRIENLVKTYGSVHALDGLSLNVEAGCGVRFPRSEWSRKNHQHAHPLRTWRVPIADGRGSWIRKLVSRESDVRSLIGVLPEEPAFYGVDDAARISARLCRPAV